MDTVRIDFCGFWGSFNKRENLFVRLLSKHFDVEISDDPDFVICSNRGAPFEYMRYDCVRVMFMGENLSPDFTVFDYVIGFDRMQFGDRYFRLPYAYYFESGTPWTPEKLTRAQAEDILRRKTQFCNFIYGHPSGNGAREKLFDALSRYKPVVSPGSYLNNTGSGGCTWAEKNRVLEASKFTIAADSVDYPGFVTEKVIQPLDRHSVPIYFGDPTIGEELNEKAMILCRSADDTDIRAAAERAAYLDAHDDAYLDVLMQPPFREPDFLEKKYRELEAFLVAVFSQPPEKARRRIHCFSADLHCSYLREYMRKNAAPSVLTRAKRAAKHVLEKR